jgi:voltage-dependent potassium channel beta subunit
MQGTFKKSGRYNPLVLVFPSTLHPGVTIMNYRRMGNSGLLLSEISLGAWITFGDQIDDETASELLHRAYDRGVNYFDNADIYANGHAETVMGEAIKDLQRETLVLSSKVYWPTMEGPNGKGLSRKHIMESCHASLKRLDVEYLDLYFCHRYDENVPLEEVVRAMDDLVHQGKVLYWGTSEWRAAQIANAQRIARQWGLYRPMVEQPHYNMLVRRFVEDEIVPAADDLGFGLVTWSPLRSGLLSGKYNQATPDGARLSLEDYDWLHGILTEENLAKAQRLESVAQELGVSLPQLAIGWLLRLPQVTSVISGATKVAQLEENLQAIKIPEMLTPDVLETIEGILMNEPKS